MIALDRLPNKEQIRSAVKRRLFTTSEAARFSYRNVREPKRAAGRLLLLTDFREYTSDQQYAPIMRNSRALYESANINSAVASLSSARGRKDSFLRGFDVVGIKLSFRNSAESAQESVADIRSRMSPSQKLVYFDGDDDLNVQWPEVLRLVDLYVKKHIFRDLHDYENVYQGKSNLSDYVVRNYGQRFSDAHVMQSGPLRAADLGRVRASWNVALDDRIFRLAQKGLTPATTPRIIDVCGRATASKDDWVLPLRRQMTERMKELADGINVALPTERVSLDEYYRELKSSTICVSPFGYGEICWRDFEAIISGCLLVKPDMSHVRTDPDIFIPGVTYAPVAWDYSNLAEVCSTYLGNAAKREEVVRQAQEALVQALRPEWVVGRVRNLHEAALAA